MKKNGQHRYKYIVLGRYRSYFVKINTDSTKKFSEIDIINMLEYFIDNIFAMCSGRVFHQISYLWVQTVLLLSPGCSFIHIRQTSYRDFASKSKRSYPDPLRSRSATRIYPIELEIKDTTDTDRLASYLHLHVEIDSERRSRTQLYDKRDDFYFLVVNFPFICSNISAAPAYGVYISQWMRYSRACGSYQDRGLLLRRKLLNQSSYWGHHFLRSPPWLGWKSWPFPHLWHHRFVTWRVPLMDQELLTLP